MLLDDFFAVHNDNTLVALPNLLSAHRQTAG